VQVVATLECEARRTVDLRAWSSMLLSAMTSESDLIHEPKGRLVYPAMVSVAGLLGRGWASWAEHIRNPQSATNYHLEDLTGNGPREAGVFTLADAGFIRYPIDTLLARYGLEERPVGRQARPCR